MFYKLSRCQNSSTSSHPVNILHYQPQLINRFHSDPQPDHFCSPSNFIFCKSTSNNKMSKHKPIRQSAATCHMMVICNTSGSAVAEGPRDVLVSRNSATYKTSHLKTIVWHYLQTDGQTDGRTDIRRWHIPRLA